MLADVLAPLVREWEEVARRMGRSEGAVRMLWARALKQLRPLIEKRL